MAQEIAQESANLDKIIDIINDAVYIFDVSKKSAFGIFANCISEYIVISGGKTYSIKLSDDYQYAILSEITNTGRFIDDKTTEVYGKPAAKTVSCKLNIAISSLNKKSALTKAASQKQYTR